MITMPSQQYSRQYAVDLLERLGYRELADEALRGAARSGGRRSARGMVCVARPFLLHIDERDGRQPLSQEVRRVPIGPSSTGPGRIRPAVEKVVSGSATDCGLAGETGLLVIWLQLDACRSADFWQTDGTRCEARTCRITFEAG